MLVKENTVLIVIDIQGNLAQAMYEKEFLFDNLKKIIRGGRLLEIPMIVTEQIPEKLGPTIPEIASLLTGIQPLPKSSFSCCGDKGFMETLKKINRKQILIAGIESHVCLYQTTADLLGSGYEVQVIADCVSSRTAQNRKIGIERMKSEGARITSTEMALFELLKVGEGDIFRQMIKIVK